MRNKILIICSCLWLMACAIGPDYKRPSMPLPAVFKEVPASAASVTVSGDTSIASAEKRTLQTAPHLTKQLVKATPQDDTARGKWWEVFKDKYLNTLEEQVAVNNQNVKASEAAFEQARALVTEARAAYFPTLNANGSFSRSGSGGGSGSAKAGSGTIISTGNTAISTGSGTGKSGYVINNYNASLDAAWVPDIWGKIRRQVESSKAGAEASAADLASATLSAQADLAIDYLDLRVADAQKRLLDDTIMAYTKSLQITENQYKIGVAAKSDVLQAKVQLETTHAQEVDVGVARAQYEHAIAVLLGKAPADFSIITVNSVPLLPEIPSSLPSQLLERRPDIAGAERRVAVANAQIGVAEAAFYPDLTLSASGGYTSSMLSQWFSMPSRFWSIGPSLVETIFDAGLRAAQTEAAIAAYDQTVATYRQTVLSAFQNVEDNLAALRILAQESDVLDGAVKDAKAATTILINQYKAGTITYLNVVTAQAAALNDELSALNVNKARLTAAATLIENLGGGWNDQELNKPQVTQGRTSVFSILPPKAEEK